MAFDFERALVVVNRKSTGYDLNRFKEEIISPINRHNIPAAVFDTKPDPTDDENTDSNRLDIKRLLMPGDIIVVCGGDGTVNQVANAVIDSGYASETAVIVAPYGHANDLAYAINGSERFNLADVLKSRGQRIRRDIGTIAVKATGIETNFNRHAVGYVGFGLTALLGTILNDNTYRDRRQQSRHKLATDLKTLLPYTMQVPQFEYTFEDEVKKAIELLFISSSRMAGRFNFARSIFDNENMSHVNISHFAELAVRLLQAKLKAVKGIATQSAVFELKQPVGLQIDGETFQTEPLSRLNIDFVKSSIGVIACNGY